MKKSEAMGNDLLIPWFARFIAVTQIVGASSSAVIILPAMLIAQNSLLSLPFFVVMYTIFAAAFLSGIWLWNGERRGYKVSMLIQALQIPVLSSALLTYKFVFGLGIIANLMGGAQPVNFDVGGQSYLVIGNEVPKLQLGINVWAPIALVYLWRNVRGR